MATKTFINLAIKDVPQTRTFFGNLGFSFNEQFSNENAICMVISEESYAMLLHETFFKDFTRNELADAKKVTEVMVALSYENKDEVNSVVDKAIQMGATEAREPQDHGFMFARSFHDLDGHIWEIFCMDMSQFPQQ